MVSSGTNNKCGKCGAALSAESPDGLCAGCLLESALDYAGGSGFRAPFVSFRDYELLEEVARGGMGVVYRARQVSLNRQVAVKMILAGRLATETEVTRFRSEAEAAARLHHPGIVTVHETGEHAGCQFFSMDYVAGKTLADVVRDGPVSAEQAARYTKSVAEAIHHAHKMGILHRDLKPSNVLIDPEDRPRVTDFGLAKWLEGKSELTASGQVLGSPSFMPPEQAGSHAGATGPWSDVYSLGAILYHLLTGRAPFVADTPTATLRLVIEADPVSPRLLNPGVPVDLETICLKCLQKAPADRYGSAAELAEELGRVLRDEPIRARPIGNCEMALRWCRRNRSLSAALASIVLLLLVVTVGSTIAALHINRERLQAQASEKKFQRIFLLVGKMLGRAGPVMARGRDSTMLEEILAETAAMLGTELRGQPEAESDIRKLMGKTYAEMGMVSNALAMTREAARLRSQLGREDAELAQVLNNLGVMLYNTGDLTNAEAVDRRTLAMRLRVLPRDHPDVALSYNNLGVCLWSQGRLAEAEASHLQALEIRRKVFPEDHPEVGMSLVNLGNVRGARGDFLNAEEHSAAVLRLYAKALPADHPDLLILSNNWAVYLGKKGELGAAEAIQRRNLEVCRRLYKGDHEQIADSRSHLAQLLMSNLELSAAEEAVQAAIDMQHRMNLLENSDYADYLATKGSVLLKKGQWDDARLNLQQALDLRIKLLGATNIDVVECLDSLAVAAIGRRQMAEAEQLLRRALDLGEKSESGRHPSMIAVQYHLAWVLRAQGKPAAARPYHIAVVEQLPRQGAYSCWHFLKAVCDITDLLQRCGEHREARDRLAEAAELLVASGSGATSTLQRHLFRQLVDCCGAWQENGGGAAARAEGASWRRKLDALQDNTQVN